MEPRNPHRRQQLDRYHQTCDVAAEEEVVVVTGSVTLL